MTEQQIAKIHEQKRRFVENELKAALKGSVPSITNVTYKTKNGEEIVTIHFIDGEKKPVCVTGDSLLAVAKDVFGSIDY